MTDIERLKEIISNSKKIVFFGGAGVSTESGIPDFRSADGIYSQGGEIPPEIILSHTFFMSSPDLFYKFYREKMVYLDAKPNACHYKLASLENEGKLSAIVTQNIDELHQQAGSKKVLELHGSIYKNKCIKCGKKYSIDGVLNSSEVVPLCSCGGIIKPEVVLYEEELDSNTISETIRQIHSADTLIICGTSLKVYPANTFIQFFGGENLVIINKEPLDCPIKPTLFIQDLVGKVFSQI